MSELRSDQNLDIFDSIYRYSKGGFSCSYAIPLQQFESQFRGVEKISSLANYPIYPDIYDNDIKMLLTNIVFIANTIKSDLIERGINIDVKNADTDQFLTMAVVTNNQEKIKSFLKGKGNFVFQKEEICVIIDIDNIKLINEKSNIKIKDNEGQAYSADENTEFIKMIELLVKYQTDKEEKLNGNF